MGSSSSTFAENGSTNAQSTSMNNQQPEQSAISPAPSQEAPMTNNTLVSSPKTAFSPKVTSSPKASPIPNHSVSRGTTYKFVHPFIELINRKASDSEFINTMATFMDRRFVGVDERGVEQFEYVDQMQFFLHTMQVFSYCANNGKESVVKWLMDNYVPLQVSYDDNFCYFESMRWGHHSIVELIVSHSSFVPTEPILQDMISRGRYDLFKRCMSSPHLRDKLWTYRHTFLHYLQNNDVDAVNNLFNLIKNKSSVIPDPVMESSNVPESSSVESPTTQPMEMSVENPNNAETALPPPAESTNSPMEVESTISGKFDVASQQ